MRAKGWNNGGPPIVTNTEQGTTNDMGYSAGVAPLPWWPMPTPPHGRETRQAATRAATWASRGGPCPQRSGWLRALTLVCPPDRTYVPHVLKHTFTNGRSRP